jgi:hypothetical protein
MLPCNTTRKEVIIYRGSKPNLKRRGLLFLKCFSEKEPLRDAGPYRFSHDMIKKIFEISTFKIQSIRETVYPGTLNPLPKALL